MEGQWAKWTARRARLEGWIAHGVVDWQVRQIGERPGGSSETADCTGRVLKENPLKPTYLYVLTVWKGADIHIPL